MEMKRFNITIQSAICDWIDGGEPKVFDAPIIIHAFDRYEAMMTALDMAQAMSRGMQFTEGQYTLFFRIADIQEIGG